MTTDRGSHDFFCQRGTWLIRARYFSVSEPKTEILGAPDLYINRGSTINLTCVVLQSPEPPSFIFWNHNDVVSSSSSAKGLGNFASLFHRVEKRLVKRTTPVLRKQAQIGDRGETVIHNWGTACTGVNFVRG